LLPAGNLRESKSEAKRANCIVVTKCPVGLSLSEMVQLEEKVRVTAEQPVYFTSIKYQQPVGPLATLQSAPFLLVTGIADPGPLCAHLEAQNATFSAIHFADHHRFTALDIARISKRAKAEGYTHILTTEKDMQRLPIHDLNQAGLEVSCLSIGVVFLAGEAEFKAQITTYLAGKSA
jgi:tetraacyldisaccharide 4'-kinase